MLSQLTRSPTQKSSPHLLNLQVYCQRLKEGESLNDLLDTIGSEEEEKFLCDNLNVLQVYEDGLSKLVMTQVVEMLQSKKTLKQVITTLRPREISMIIDHIPQLKLLSQEINAVDEFQRLVDEMSFNTSASSSITGLVQTTSALNNFTLAESVIKNQGNWPKEPVSHQVKAGNPQEQSVHEPEPPKYSSSQRQYYTGPQPVPQKQSQQALVDPDELADTTITFGKLYGKTFKQVLDEQSKHFTWFRWLKYEYKKATSDLGCAKKAFMYFSQKLLQWDDIEPITNG